MQLKASAPGSLMLLGEYAVLYGHKALVAAINKRMTVQLEILSDDKLIIQSDLYGFYQSSIASIDVVEPFHFILQTIKTFADQLPCGARFTITSEFSDKLGFGSSAALVAATLGLLNSWLNLNLSRKDLVKKGKDIIIHLQGVGSGADIGAAIFGGIISYQNDPLKIEKLTANQQKNPLFPSVSAHYCGFKTKTADAIKRVQENFKSKNTEFQSIMTLIGNCVEEGIQSLRQENWDKLGNLFSMQQGLMTSLGVNLPILQQLVENAMRDPVTLGAKISGSGFGDSVIALMSAEKEIEITVPGSESFALAITQQGLHCEELF